MSKPCQPHRTAAVAVLAVGVMGLLGAVASADEDESKKPPTPVEQMHAELDMVQKLLKNASIKLNNDTVSSASSGAGGTTSSPVQQCCSQNLERIDKRLAKVREILSGLAACYESSRNVEAADTLEQVNLDMRSLTDGLEAFRGSKSRSGASGAYQGIGQAWIQLRDDARWLRDCPATPSGSSNRK
jgi:hypothetical protein